jgi:DNA-binding transcriptional LysR family regulator
MQDIDLNLLPVAHALLVEQSVTRAAERLYLSVPATSRALDRCRRVFGDELLVRHGRGVIITPKGEEVLRQIGPLLDDLRSLLSGDADLNPAQLRRRFAVCANEAVIAALGAPLLGRLSVEAPGVELRFLQEGPNDLASLASGDAALAIGSYSDVTNEFASEAVAVEHMVGVIAHGHPLASSRITLARYAELDHIVVSRRGQALGPIDEYLAQSGRSRRIVAVVPTFSAALAMCAQTDSTTIAPQRLASVFAPGGALTVFRAPLPLPDVQVDCVWHRRFDSDPAHAWFRSVVSSTASRPT